MRRREFITLLTGVAVGWPLMARAQQAGKVSRVGLIATAVPVSEMAGPEPLNSSSRAFVQGLRALGYVEGRISSWSTGRPRDGTSDSATSSPS
jgi:putative tryptophan/tyrosine transport system substrate-binding protein